jgi:hypothetical protein
MENLRAVLSRRLNCYDAGRERHDCHGRSGQRHLGTPAGEFKIWALDDHRLRVEFSVAAEHKGVSGPMGNASDGHGIARIQGDTAIFKPDGADPDCRITLKFKRRSLVITQTSTCDFGKYANVDGT